jgi:hypothetical protein
MVTSPWCCHFGYEVMVAIAGSGQNPFSGLSFLPPGQAVAYRQATVPGIWPTSRVTADGQQLIGRS